MKILKSARKDRMGEALNVHMIKTINVRADGECHYVTAYDGVENVSCDTKNKPKWWSDENPKNGL